MLPGLVRLSVPALLIAGAAGLIYFGADKAPGLALDGNSPSSVQSYLDKGSLSDAEMERRQQIYHQRIVIKDRAVRDLLAGRLTLVQAAAQFRDVEKEHPVTWWPRNAATDAAEGERLCRVVMEKANGWVKASLPSQAAAVAALLEAELERHRGPDGTVCLPD
jgi:hypothetical protein